MEETVGVQVVEESNLLSSISTPPFTLVFGIDWNVSFSIEFSNSPWFAYTWFAINPYSLSVRGGYLWGWEQSVEAGISDIFVEVIEHRGIFFYQRLRRPIIFDNLFTNDWSLTFFWFLVIFFFNICYKVPMFFDIFDNKLIRFHRLDIGMILTNIKNISPSFIWWFV